ncbi:nucleotide sugar dehydrogenase [Dietzia sp. CH92]|uniref:nucleotide sugar dehydrogenase n=1 Tax=Dietzia sp. CH92 TaxID=3051823 RepID=UPI0028D708B2|nr:nucleotide sugar dehydrogenase [Dietzia sp. CH92]
MSMRAVIVGLGYVGLPLAREAALAGLEVVGLDVDQRVASAINNGRSHIDDLSDEDVEEMLRSGFRASTDPAVLNEAAVAVVCVPTPLSAGGGPDLSAVTSAMTMIAEHIHRGMLVILESTTYPGTTDEVVRPLLESSGLTAGSDFFLAFSPERIDPGNPEFGAKNTPKVVGGFTEACADCAVEFYSKFVNQTIRTRGTREAEMAKLLENTYRHVNIALVNEMARFCHDLNIDLWDVIGAAKSKPFGFQAFYPGPGVGGHCIPIDPNYLSHNVKARLGYPFRFVELAQEVNARMPAYIVERAQEILNDRAMALRGSHILLLGVTYKPDIADQRESPAASVAEKLISNGAVVHFHDPLVEDWSRVSSAHRADDVESAAADADLTILLQNHRAYNVERLASLSRAFFDTRGATGGDHKNVVRL